MSDASAYIDRVRQLRVLCCGSRSWTSEKSVDACLCQLPAVADGRRIVVMHGGASGADALFDRIAREMGFEVEVFPADWKRHGRKAGILRNLAMLDTKPDLVIACWNGRSPGTKHVVSEAQRRGIRVMMCVVDD